MWCPPPCPRHAADIECTLVVLVMFAFLGYELDMARSSSALRRPPAAPSVPAGGFARRGPPGSAQVPPAAVDLGQPPDAEVAVNDHRRNRYRAPDHHTQRVTRHLVRPLDQSLSWLRAWLCLLLRAPHSR